MLPKPYHGRTFAIYALAHPVTKEVRYVGKSIDAEFRFYMHCWDAENRPSTHLHRWIAKLAREELLPDFLILEETTDETWAEDERRWIAHYRALGNRMCNHYDGGEGIHNPTPETRAKMSASHKGFKYTPEQIAKRIRYGADNQFYGHRHTAESKRKISEAKIGKPSGGKGIPKKREVVDKLAITYRMTHLRTGTVIEFHNLSRHCRETGLNRSMLQQAASGKLPAAYGCKVERIPPPEVTPPEGAIVHPAAAANCMQPYMVQTLDGVTYFVRNLEAFAREWGVNPALFRTAYKLKRVHAGWKVWRLDA
jgi:NUMOD3 motif